MGAVVVAAGLSSANWAKQKPADYKGRDLDQALKGYESLAAKRATIPSSLPVLPNGRISEIDSCITEMESSIVELQKAQAHLKQLVAALQAVVAAAARTSADLRRLAKGTAADTGAYENAASTADVIEGKVSKAVNDLKKRWTASLRPELHLG